MKLLTSVTSMICMVAFTAGCTQTYDKQHAGNALSPQAKAAETVTIKRDRFGTPHIYASSNYGLFYGYGRAIATDRLYQLEILKRSSQGRVSEVLGKDYLPFDETQRTLFWPADIKAQIAKLPPGTRDIFRGFAAGINAQIAVINANPDALLPKEFFDNGFRPSHWDAYDVAMLYVGTMLLRYGDFNTELDNLAFLQELIKRHGKKTAEAIFNAVDPLTNAYAPTTIAAGSDLGGHAKFNAADLPAVQNPAPAATKKPFKMAKAKSAFSNAFVLGKSHLKDADAILVNGPQFGWFVPAYTYSVGLHAPGWDAVGNAPVGYTLPMFGHNANITWGSTWAAGDNVDIFVEKLNPDGSDSYLHNGSYKPLETRVETILVKDAPAKTIKVYRSLHGPIIKFDRQHHIAYSKQRGWAGRELGTIVGWMEATQARNHDEWLKAVSKSGLNVNWYYADKQGNIGYFYGGAYPDRRPEQDNRLPTSGTGEMDWRSIHPASWNPQTFNPKSGFIANWNNKPAPNFRNPDEWWYSWGEADRVTVLQNAIRKAGPLTPEGAWNIMKQAAFTDPNAEYFLPFMINALKSGLNSDRRFGQILDILSHWDHKFEAAGPDHKYSQPANLIFREWLSKLLKNTLADDLPGPVGAALASSTGYGTPDAPTTAGTNITVGLKIVYENLQGRGSYDFFNGVDKNQVLLTSLKEVLDANEKTLGTDISQWRLPQPSTRFHNKNFLGIPQTSKDEQNDDLPDMNRGTENNMTVFSGGIVTGYEVVPPGESGFIDKEGRKSPHYSDQMGLYGTFGKKRTWLYKSEVDNNSEYEIMLTVPPHSDGSVSPKP